MTDAPLSVPPDLAERLAQQPAAQAAFQALPPSHQREYLTWIGEAKRPATRERRLGKTVEMLLAPPAGRAK